jgi:hypothetical protein
MAYGSSTPSTDPSAAAPGMPGAAAAPAGASATGQTPGAGLTDNQIKAITMLMSNLGKQGQMAQGFNASQGQGMYPHTSTIQGGTFFNPNQQR